MNSSFLIMILISYSPINIFVTIILPKYIIKKKVHFISAFIFFLTFQLLIYKTKNNNCFATSKI